MLSTTKQHVNKRKIKWLLPHSGFPMGKDLLNPEESLVTPKSFGVYPNEMHNKPRIEFIFINFRESIKNYNTP